jgi:hypothetical protein
MTLARSPAYQEPRIAFADYRRQCVHDLEISMTEDLKRTVMAPSNARPMTVGELLSFELGADEDAQWVWCHHGERGSSVIGHTVVPRETIEIPEKRPIGFFALEDKSSGH